MKLRHITILTAMLIALAACHRGPKLYRPVVDPELLKLDKEQIYQRGEDSFNHHKWQKARTYFTHLYETYPNDPLGRRSLLRIADTYYEQGDPVNLVEAQYKYRDFINRYPTSEQADYAMLRIAMCSFRQMEKPDRDQAKTKEAVEKFNDMLRTYPNSKLRGEATARRQDALDRLAKHEHNVARFYINRGSWNAAVQRLNFLIDTYPNYNDRAAAFYDLGTALSHLGRAGEARLYFERVVTEFPKSEWAEPAKKRLAATKDSKA
ncbi:MAG TPA: outer membrane protein assembly factor BamD [Thermoanaerobaculia bacterium]|nr:outer membrane protein assembly factor BamD [Thermoanaerobaculia bacterium]